MVCDDIFVTSSGEMKLKRPAHTVRKKAGKIFCFYIFVLDHVNFYRPKAKTSQKRKYYSLLSGRTAGLLFSG